MRAIADEQLIRWVADGDSSCLATLFERHHRSVYRFCLQLTRNPAQSEDLVQDVFLRMLRKAKSFRGDGSFKGWMFNIARNVTLDHLRKSSKHHDQPLSDELLDSEHVDTRTAERAAADSQRINRVMKALNQLPAAAQEVIWLGRFEFDNYEELGQALACTASTARVRMHRAMAALNSTYKSIYGVPVDA